MYGAKWMCIKPIRFCARLGVLWCDIWVQKSIRAITSFSIHRILMTFGHTLHLWYRMKLYWIHQNMPPDWKFMGWNWGTKKHPEHYLLIKTQYFNKIRPQASSRMPNAGLISPSKFAAGLGVIVHRMKLECKLAQGIYLPIYTQDLNQSRSVSVDYVGCRTVRTRWTTRPMNSTPRCRPNFV